LPWTGLSKTKFQSGFNSDTVGHRIDSDFVDDAATNLKPYLSGTQVTVSENHPAWRSHVSGRNKGDLGGPFSSTKRYVLSTPDSPQSVSYETPPSGPFNAVSWAKYLGPVWPISPDLLSFPPYAQSSDSSLDKQGAVAISRVGPANPVADLSVFLAETIKDGIPHLVGSGLKGLREMTHSQRRKAVGSEYLNVEFGWKPFVNDLKQIGHSVIDADAIWQQYERDAGKLVRRRYEFPVTESITVDEVRRGTNFWPYLVGPTASNFFLPRGSQDVAIVYRSHKITRRQWFSGAFTYVLPQGDSLRDSIARNVIQAKKMLGLTLTPDTLWAIAPWSWAVDWFSNTSNVLDNWSDWAIDGQVLVYGYMMEHTVSSYTYTWSGPAKLSRYLQTPGDITLVSETKVRRQATPYGFGLQWSQFTPRQLAITASLGLTRS